MRVSNSLIPDQDRYFVSPDLGPNCLQRLSADDKSPLARKEVISELIKFNIPCELVGIWFFVAVTKIDNVICCRFLVKF